MQRLTVEAFPNQYKNYPMHLGELYERVLVFGGPYSNLQATEAMHSKALSLGIPANHTICTGDLVAYCGKPEETVNLIRHWGVPVVMGNCEESLGFDEQDCGCGFEEGSLCSTLSVDWYAYAQRALSSDNKLWMQTLPRHLSFTFSGKRFHVLHGGSEDISQFIFASSAAAEKSRQITLNETDVIIGGHCGIPFGDQLPEGAWLNAGVIGMPANDGTLSSWYMVLESHTGEIQCSWHRLEYDNVSAAEDMKTHSLRMEYHDALLSGLWPSMDVLPEVEKAAQNQVIRLGQRSL